MDLDALQQSLITLVVVAGIQPATLLAYDRVSPEGQSLGPLFAKEGFQKQVANNIIRSRGRSFQSFRSSAQLRSKSSFNPLPQDFNTLSGIKLARKTKTPLPTWSRSLYRSQFHPPDTNKMPKSKRKKTAARKKDVAEKTVAFESDESSTDTHSYSQTSEKTKSKSKPRPTKDAWSQAMTCFPDIFPGGTIEGHHYDYAIKLGLSNSLTGVLNALGLYVAIAYIHRGILLDGEATSCLMVAVQPPGPAGSDIDSQIREHPPILVDPGHVLLTVKNGHHQFAQLLGKLMEKVNEDTSRVGGDNDVAGVRNVAISSLQGLLTAPDNLPEETKVLLELPPSFQAPEDISFLQNNHFVAKYGTNVLYPEFANESSTTFSDHMMENIVEAQTGYVLLIPGSEKENNFGIQAKVPEPPAAEDPLEALKRDRQNLHNTQSGSGTERSRLSVLTDVDDLAERLEEALTINIGKFARSHCYIRREPAAIF